MFKWPGVFRKFDESLDRLLPHHRFWLSFGILLFLLITVPLSLWGLMTGDFELRKRAVTGEVAPAAQVLRFRLRFKGITSRPVNDGPQPVQIYATSRDGGDNIGSAGGKELVTVLSDDAGVYRGELVLTGAYFGYHYRLRVKGPKHLQAVFHDVVFQPGSELDLTSWPLRPGDLNLDARVDEADLLIINERMFSSEADDLALADVNFDQRVDIVDRSLVLNNISTQSDLD